MMNAGQFAKGISEMAEKCPFNGSVTAVFTFHSGEVREIRVTSEGINPEEGCEKAINVFTPVITQMLMYKLDKKKLYYGNVTVVVSVTDGECSCTEFLVSEKVSPGQARILVRTEQNRRRSAA